MRCCKWTWRIKHVDKLTQSVLGTYSVCDLPTHQPTQRSYEMQFEPCGHRVLIQPDVVEEKTASGIILTTQTQQRDQQATMRGTVAAVGVNAWKAFDDGTPWAAVGDRVVFRRYAGEVIKEGDQEYRVVNDEDLISVIREG